METDGADGVAECQAGFPIPRSRVGCAGTVEKITGPERDETVESEQSRRGSRYGFVGPLALCLDTQVRAGFGKGDLDLPSADVEGDYLGGLEGDVGTEEGLRAALFVRIANQDPADRQDRSAGPVP